MDLHSYAFIAEFGIATTVCARSRIEAISVYRDLGYSLETPGLRILVDGEDDVSAPDDSDLEVF